MVLFAMGRLQHVCWLLIAFDASSMIVLFKLGSQQSKTFLPLIRLSCGQGLLEIEIRYRKEMPFVPV